MSSAVSYAVWTVVRGLSSARCGSPRATDNPFERGARSQKLRRRGPPVSFASSRCRAVLACLAAIAASAAFSGPASADGGEDAAAGCPAVAAVQPFGPWQDFADYFLAPDGGFEAGAEDWDL